MTCTNTPRLLGDDCPQDAGIIEIGILHSRIAARFGFHMDTALNPPKHYNVSFTACNSMFSSSACDVKGTRCLYQGHTCRTASKLLVPYLEAFLCYAQPVPKLVLISSFASAAFQIQQICNSLVEISCRCRLSSCTTFTHVSLAPPGKCSAVINAQEDTLDTDFVTSILTSQFSATAEEEQAKNRCREKDDDKTVIRSTDLPRGVSSNRHDHMSDPLSLA